MATRTAAKGTGSFAEGGMMNALGVDLHSDRFTAARLGKEGDTVREHLAT
jgi:hypothetical protein